jgi:hypothetical protein
MRWPWRTEIREQAVLAPDTQADEDALWRPVAGGWSQKDALPATYLEIHKQCYEAYCTNPLARQTIEITTSMVLGSGLKVVAGSPRVQRILNRFWNDPDNHMDMRVYSLCTELALYGEQFVRVFVNPIDGAVKIGQIDPSTIDDVVTDPNNVERPLRFHQMDDSAQGRWFEAGTEVVQFAINKVSNAKRGQSDLATMLVWLQRYKDWLTDRVRLNKYKGAFLWDVKLTGADKKAIDRKKMEYAYPPPPGSIVVHNEQEEWTAVEPRIGADQVEADGKAIKMMIAVGAGLPEHYLAEGGNVNRATAAEMGLPTVKRFERRQDYIGFMLRTLLDRVLQEAEAAGLLTARVDRRYEIIFPPITVQDGEGIASTLAKLVPALQAAKQEGWLDDAAALKLLHRFLGGDAFDATEQRP